MPCAHCLLSGLLPPAPDSKPTLCSIFRVTYLDVPSQRAGHPVLCTAPVSPTLVSVSIGMKEGINLKCIDDRVSTCLKKKKKSFSDFSSPLGKMVYSTCHDRPPSSSPAALYLTFSALTALNYLQIYIREILCLSYLASSAHETCFCPKLIFPQPC